MIAPADEHDALPFEGEGAHGGGMVFTFGDLFEDKYFGPVAVEEGLTGIFEEGLMDEVGPTPATMDPELIFAAAFGDRSDPAVLLDGGSVLVARAVAPQSRGEARGQGWTCSGEAFPDKGIGMGSEELPDARIVCFERSRELE